MKFTINVRLRTTISRNRLYKMQAPSFFNGFVQYYNNFLNYTTKILLFQIGKIDFVAFVRYNVSMFSDAADDIIERVRQDFVQTVHMAPADF